MRSYELTFTIEGDYSDYYIQQLVAERIFAMQGHQNQLYHVRNVRWIKPDVCAVTLHMRQPELDSQPEPGLLHPIAEPVQPVSEPTQEPELSLMPDPEVIPDLDTLPEPTREPELSLNEQEALDELSLYEGPEEE